KPARAERRPFRNGFDRKPSPPRDMEAVHEGGKTLVGFPQPGSRTEDSRIQPSIEVEQESFEPRFPVLWKQVAQRGPPGLSPGTAARRAEPGLIQWMFLPHPASGANA